MSYQYNDRPNDYLPASVHFSPMIPGVAALLMGVDSLSVSVACDFLQDVYTVSINLKGSAP